jgi:xanthine/uracil permease
LGGTVAGRRDDGLALGAVVLSAVLMICSGLIHIHLWDIAYRHVATLGPLFLVQAVAALVLAVVLVGTRLVVVALACISLMLGTVGGFILADTVGLFGFKLPAVTGWADEALITELLSALLLGVLVLRAWRTARARVARVTRGVAGGV